MCKEKHSTDKKYKNGIWGKPTQNYRTLSKAGEERRPGRKSTLIMCLLENKYFLSALRKTEIDLTLLYQVITNLRIRTSKELNINSLRILN